MSFAAYLETSLSRVKKEEDLLVTEGTQTFRFFMVAELPAWFRT